MPGRDRPLDRRDRRRSGRPDHIFIGTDVARHGSSSVNGGRFTPPGSAQVGLYESTDGGASFSPVLILAQDVIDPTLATGGDFFRGGISDIQIDKHLRRRLRLGVRLRPLPQFRQRDGSRSSPPQVGGTVGNSSFSRTEFSLAPDGSNLRIYVGDTGTGTTADFYTVANARGVPAATLLTGGTNGGWTQEVQFDQRHAGLRLVQLLRRAVLVRHARVLPARVPGRGLHRRRDAVRRDLRRRPTRSARTAARSSARRTTATNFTDMTIDSKGISLHPDQHAIAGVAVQPRHRLHRERRRHLAARRLVRRRLGPVRRARGSRWPADLTDCQNWLSKTPKTITSLNDGLSTLQFQSLSVERQEPEGHPGRDPGQRDAGDDERQEVVRDHLRRRRPVRHQRRQPEDPDAHVLLDRTAMSTSTGTTSWAGTSWPARCSAAARARRSTCR